jgi:predicted O-methyltransferase YrrM
MEPKGAASEVRALERDRDRWERLCHEAESQRDDWQRLCHEAEAQRDEWRQNCHESELQRDEWRWHCREAESQREHWQARCGEAEAGRDDLRAHLEEIQGERERFRGVEATLPFGGINRCVEVNAQLVMRERVLLYALVFSLGPRRVLEIGTATGGSARIISAALSDLKLRGSLVTIDPHPAIDFDWSEVAHNTETLRGSFPGDYRHRGPLFDFVFVDGDHSYSGVLRDLEAVPDLLAEGGYVLLHDAFNAEVARGIDEALHRLPYADCGLIGRVRNDSLGDGEFGGLRLLRRGSDPGDLGDLLERGLAAWAAEERNHDRFAALLAEVLPGYARTQWGGDGPNRRHFAEWQRHGFNLTANHHYSPIPDLAEASAVLDRRSALRGLELNAEAQLRFLEEVCPRYREEYTAFRDGAGGAPHDFHFQNGVFERVDAEVLHCMVRHHRPKRMIEVGSGFSTLISAAACARNAAEGSPCDFVAIEPYPNDLFRRSVPGLTRLVEQPLQVVDPKRFEDLDAGDILFIDSTHVLKTGSDVALLYLDVIPGLRPGVLVHVHDVFLPDEYPRSWIEQEHVFWNEQYLLQAFLAFNRCYEVLWAGSYLRRDHPQELIRAFPGFSPERHLPGSFWMRRTS